jgi:protein-disulfide isomerase
VIRTLSLAAALALAASFAAAAVTDPQSDDMALGKATARVTVVEYASVGCPHCAKWANEVFPAFKAKYVDTGKARFVLRELLTGDPALAAAGFMVARCAGPAKYFDVVDGVYQHQAEMFTPGASRGDLLEGVAKSAGMSDEAFQACLTTQANLDALNARADRHHLDGIDSTPTFFVNGQRIDGEVPLDQLAAAIRAAERHRR